MSSFCPNCGREIVWGQTETGSRVALSLPPERRYYFLYEATHRPVVREVDTYIPHGPQCGGGGRHRRTQRPNSL